MTTTEVKEPLSAADGVFIASGSTAVGANVMPHHISLSETYIWWFNIYDWIAILSFLLMTTTFLCFQLPRMVNFLVKVMHKEDPDKDFYENKQKNDFNYLYAAAIIFSAILLYVGLINI